MLTIKELYIYPIKSAAGIALTAADVTRRGLQWDRRWMLVDEQGLFLTQRTLPQLACVQIALQADHLLLTAPGCPPLEVPLAPHAGLARMSVRVWRDTCEAQVLPAPVSSWFSTFLGRPCKLVFMPESTWRAVDTRFASDDEVVGFADGFPFLLVGEGSLAELNERLGEPVTMQRFRPNIVVAGSAPFAEDSWESFRIGATSFRIAKPCSRCVIVNVDPARGVSGREPLQTLARYRRFDKGVMFGQLLVHQGGGKLQVGDRLEDLQLRA